mgnify:CR=1 FL=1
MKNTLFNFKMLISAICIFAVLGVSFASNNTSVETVSASETDVINDISITDSTNTTTVVTSNEKFRGLWVSTIYNLDYPSQNTSSSEFLKKEADTILNECQDMGINAVILQVRPMSDAFYKSDIFPWSRYISGTEGVAPDNGFDPLEYWVSEAHKRNIELHAWLNPFRVSGSVTSGQDVYAKMADNNPAKLNKSYVVKYTANGKDSYYYNPALPEVRQLIIDGAVEIVKNYDVDAIHIDDYFYPAKDFNDDAAFKQYGSGFSSKDDWRRNNVSYFIREMYRQIHEANDSVEFGVSPAGIWANKSSNALGSDTSGSEAYYASYADTRKWASEGWIDYIAPQIYWYIGQKGSDYQILVNWWSDVVKDSRTKLYIGMADYKCVGANSTSPFYNGNDIKKELELNESNSVVKGEIHFTYNSLKKLPVLKDIIKAQYSKVSGSSNTSTETTTSTNTNTNANANANANKNQSDEITVIVDGQKISFDQQPIIENSRTLVPMRAIFEALGADVEWFDKTENIRAVNDKKEIIMKIGSPNIYVNGTDTIVLDVAPKIINSRTLVPLRAVSEVFDANVQWDNDTRTVTITTF